MKINRLSALSAMFLFLVTTIFFTLASTALARPGDEKLLRVDDFESGVIDYDQIKDGSGSHDGMYWTSGNHIGPWRTIESKIPARAGTHYLKSSVGTTVAAMPGADDDYRSELVDPPRKRVMQTNWVGKEYWVGFSSYFPSSEFGIHANGQEWDRDIIFQWHEVDISESYVCFLIGTDYDNGVLKYRLEQGWEGGHAKPWLDPVVRDKWVDWVVHVKFDYRASGGGFLQVWKDGKLVLDYQGPTMYNHVNGPIWKLGYYKPWWKSNTHPEAAEALRSVYTDEFRLGDASASYDLVAPGGSSSSTTTSTPSPTAPAGTMEAESGNLSAPMQEVSDSSATGGAYVQSSQNENGTASYTFNVDTAGIYKVVGRVNAGGSGSDSFYAKIDGQPEVTWDLNPSADPAQYNVWRDDDVTSRGAGTFDNPQYNPYTVQLTAGSHSIVFRGRESNTKLDDFRLVKVADISTPSAPANGTPTVQIQSPGDGTTFDEGTAISFSGSASDAEDGNLTAAAVWVSNLDGEIGRGGSFSKTLSPGDHTITASVTDSAGATKTSSIHITVKAQVVNNAPVQTIVSPGNNAVYDTGSIILFNGTANDAEDGDLSAKTLWVSNIDGQIGQGTSFSKALSQGTHTITASVTDSSGAIGRASVQVTVKTPSVSPTASVQAIDYSQKGKNLAVSAYVVDDSGNTVSGAEVTLAVNNNNYGSSFYTVTSNGQGRVSFNIKDPLPGCYSASVSDLLASGYLWDGGTPTNQVCQ